MSITTVPGQGGRKLVEAAKAAWDGDFSFDKLGFEAYPLVPDSFGDHVSKRAMTAAFVAVASAASMGAALPLASPGTRHASPGRS